MATIPENTVLLLEGGALRGLYTSGALDVLMEHGLWLPNIAGVSAGAINGVNYLARQPGRGGRINLCYRHDPRYSGPLAILRNHGLFGFDFMFDTLAEREPLDRKTFDENPARFYAVATDLATAEAVFFEKSTCPDFKHALYASASMPLCSLPVKVNGAGRYLDGGCSCAIPVEWALAQGFEKIVVVATRESGFRKPMTARRMIDLYTDFYPRDAYFCNALITMDWRYNQLMDRMDALEQAGRIFVLRPSAPVGIGRLERDTEKLLALLNLGRADTTAALPALQAYLGCG